MWVIFIALLVAFFLAAMAYAGSGKPGIIPGDVKRSNGLRIVCCALAVPLVIWLSVIVFTNHDSNAPGTCGMNGCAPNNP